MTQKDRNDNARVRNFTIEPLENRDAPKVAGGGLNDGPLEKGGGKPSKA